ncbi:phosphoribosylanthranilate isomerase [Mammaliicoccus sp. Dog046]|uniref:phosphoribosylanthranilate isomerase n=1 Tax=Mammaliicoccus sp. Dog046 TaxID=3034233 RepID=UPI002B25D013|nr:phosphoribosylanthranilate isomerase [Mammaliicoccus sp. Dog046]WQK84417.1 phosphoribosylanthranilate isomerase [Mammaliicoccus sp. Dog046]
MYIKCCGFQDSETITTAIQHHVDAIGFITYPKSKRYVSINEIAILTVQIPSNIDRVAVVVNVTIEEIERLIEHTNINTIQFHGDETYDFIKQVKEKYPKIKIFKALPANASLISNISIYKDVVDMFLIDTPSKDYGGTGRSFDWQILNDIHDVQYLIAGGLNEEKIKYIETLHLNQSGFDISSGIETNGKKNHEKIKSLLKNVKG